MAAQAAAGEGGGVESKQETKGALTLPTWGLRCPDGRTDLPRFAKFASFEHLLREKKCPTHLRNAAQQWWGRAQEQLSNPMTFHVSITPDAIASYSADFKRGGIDCIIAHSTLKWLPHRMDASSGPYGLTCLKVKGVDQLFTKLTVIPNCGDVHCNVTLEGGRAVARATVGGRRLTGPFITTTDTGLWERLGSRV